MLKACWEYTLCVESWHLATEWRQWLGQHEHRAVLYSRSPCIELEVTGEQADVTNNFISSFSQNNYCVVYKDTLALNNKTRDISVYSTVCEHQQSTLQLTELLAKHKERSQEKSASILLLIHRDRWNAPLSSQFIALVTVLHPLAEVWFTPSRAHWPTQQFCDTC